MRGGWDCRGQAVLAIDSGRRGKDTEEGVVTVASSGEQRR